MVSDTPYVQLYGVMTFYIDCTSSVSKLFIVGLMYPWKENKSLIEKSSLYIKQKFIM